MADPSILSRIVVVLWRPKSPGNVGSVARAMKNLGFGRLRVADPMRYEDPGFFQAEAERMAWGAVDRLRAREEHPSIDAAIADAVLVAGTTSDPPEGHRVLPPEALAEALLDAAASGTVALLLGQEDIGLTREALARCRLVGTIPTSPAYASLNLAQAALIFLWELRRAALRRAAEGAGEPASVPPPPDDAPPAQSELEGFYARLAATLDAVGYFEGGARPHMVRELRRLFNRALLTRREVRMIEGILHRVEWALNRR